MLGCIPRKYAVQNIHILQEEKRLPLTAEYLLSKTGNHKAIHLFLVLFDMYLIGKFLDVKISLDLVYSKIESFSQMLSRIVPLDL